VKEILCFIVFSWVMYLPCIVPTVSAQTEAFHQVTLEKAISIALEENRDISVADEESRKAHYRIVEAASQGMPQVNGFWNAEKVLKPMVFVIQFPDSTGKLRKNRLQVGTDYTSSLGASLTQPLYVGGKVGTALQAAQTYQKFSRENLNSIKQRVVTGVVQAFYGVLLAKEIRKISYESLVQAEKHLENVRRRYDAGKATEYDLLRARVNVSNLKPGLIEAENSITLSLLNLKEVMGIAPDSPLDITGTFSEPDTTLFEQANKAVAFDNRPDLRASFLNIDLYQKNMRIARGDFLPIVTAGTTFQFAGNIDELKYNASDWTPYWVASVNLSFPIFSGLRNYSKFKQAKIDYLNAKTEYRRKRDRTEIEISESVMNLRKALEKIESQKMNAEEAEKAFGLAESLFSNGKATQLEVLDAQLARDVARNNMASALYEGKIAEIMLKNSLGIIDIDHEKGTIR